ncbi:MAG TPA: hypothetical protein VHC49_24085 [Mycobacteriales bacterium]|nr:hypothetical protein [Mycobacteriales bacterium]
MDIEALLQEWGTAQQLGAETAEEIRSSIVDGPGLDANWWSDFSAQFAQNVMMSVQPFSMAA